MARGAGAQQSVEAARIVKLGQMVATQQREISALKASAAQRDEEMSALNEQLHALSVLVMRQKTEHQRGDAIAIKLYNGWPSLRRRTAKKLRLASLFNLFLAKKLSLASPVSNATKKLSPACSACMPLPGGEPRSREKNKKNLNRKDTNARGGWATRGLQRSRMTSKPTDRCWMWV